ncbi:MAG: hypothetical protein HKN47_25660, partial [Pirellulaceae bacterium]|nr:hypothetical protein [Pirellulaceae bacterium]
MRFGKKASILLAISAIAAATNSATPTAWGADSDNSATISPLPHAPTSTLYTAPTQTQLLPHTVVPSEPIEAQAATIEALPQLPPPRATAPATGFEPTSRPTADVSDAVVLNSRVFGIPVNVGLTGSRPVEIRLFVSRGATSEWTLLDRKPPTVKEFQFKGRDDGLFWFATRTIDSTGRVSTPATLKPQLKVVIDTTKPDVVLKADADASGRVAATLQYSDATPIKSVQVHYATDVLRQWTHLDVRTISSDGKIEFVPEQDWQQLSLQTIVADSAGNQTTVSRLLQRPRVAVGTQPILAGATSPSSDAIAPIANAAGDSTVRPDITPGSIDDPDHNRQHQIAVYHPNASNDADAKTVRLVAGTPGTPRRNMFVHRSGLQSADSNGTPIQFIPAKHPIPADANSSAATDDPQRSDQQPSEPTVGGPDATIAQTPRPMVPTNQPQRYSPVPVANSYFQSDPRTIAYPSAAAAVPTAVPQYGSSFGTLPQSGLQQGSLPSAPAAAVMQNRPAFGPPSVVGNRKQYHLIQKPAATPATGVNNGAPPAAADPMSFGALNGPNESATSSAPPSTTPGSSPNSFTLPPTMTLPETLPETLPTPMGTAEPSP